MTGGTDLPQGLRVDHAASRDRTAKDEATVRWLVGLLEESHTLFGQMGEAEKAALASAMFLLQVAPGETLIEQGAVAGEYCYVCASGEVLRSRAQTPDRQMTAQSATHASGPPRGSSR